MIVVALGEGHTSLRRDPAVDTQVHGNHCMDVGWLAEKQRDRTKDKIIYHMTSLLFSG